jgi:hypothetical protein
MFYWANGLKYSVNVTQAPSTMLYAHSSYAVCHQGAIAKQVK